MNHLKNIVLFALVISAFGIASCKGDLEDIRYSPVEYDVPSRETENLGILPIPDNNELTEQGIKLGQRLFFDPILSLDNSMSCSSCHDPAKGFTDGLSFSPGVQGLEGVRSSMSLVNAAYYTKGLFWDGRSEQLENQALLPVEDELEFDHDWVSVEEDLQNHDEYPKMFREAFGIEDSEQITKDLAVKALSQFQRIILSGNSKYDKWKDNKAVLSDEELMGFETFFDVNPLLKDGECGHCHNEPLFTSNQYFDNGLQEADLISDYKDIGRALVTGNDADYGKMRAPTLRNIALTAPYMHDGRFETLEEVVEHYDSGGHATPNRDPLVHTLNLTEEQKNGLVAFMKTLTDTTYLQNPLLVDPFK